MATKRSGGPLRGYDWGSVTPRALLVPLLLLGGITPAIPQGSREAARALAEAEAAGGRVTYRMAKGDTLEGLARAHFVRPELWRRAQAANRISDPRRIPVGRELVLNTAWLNARPVEAEVTAFRGEVTVTRGGQTVSVAVGTRVREGDLVSTAKNGFVTFTMPDASLVTMPSSSTVRIARLRQFTLGEAIERRFELVSGRAEARVTPFKSPQSSFEITTPVAVAAVRGTRFRIRYTPEAFRATQETIEGKVGVKGSRDVEQLVTAGFGTFATARDGVAAPRPLLPAPVIEQPAKVQAGQKVVFRFRPVPGARRYLVELATDAGFLDRFASIETDEPVAEFEDVPNGTLFVRASAIDDLGLVGRPGTQSFVRRLVGLIPPVGSTEPQSVEGRPVEGRSFLFRWQASEGQGTRYRFVLRAAGGPDQRLIDEVGLAAPQITLVNLPDGDYAWQVAVQEMVEGELTETWLPEEQLRVGEGGPVRGWSESGAGPAGGPGVAGAGGTLPGGGATAAAGAGADDLPAGLPGWGGPIAGTGWSAMEADLGPFPRGIFGEGDADYAYDPASPAGARPGGWSVGSRFAAGASGGGVPLLRAWIQPPAPGWGAGAGGSGWGVGAGGGLPHGPGVPVNPEIPGLPVVPPPGGGGAAPGPGLPPGHDDPGGGSTGSGDGSNSPLPDWAPPAPRGGVVPEPHAWLMMVIGFGLIGGALRRRARPRVRETAA